MHLGSARQQAHWSVYLWKNAQEKNLGRLETMREVVAIRQRKVREWEANRAEFMQALAEVPERDGIEVPERDEDDYDDL